MTDERKPYRLTQPTTYHWPGDVVHLLPHQVMPHHEPVAAHVDHASHVERIVGDPPPHPGEDHDPVYPTLHADQRITGTLEINDANETHEPEAPVPTRDLHEDGYRSEEGKDHPAGPETPASAEVAKSP
jgi:hypothetical protein